MMIFPHQGKLSLYYIAGLVLHIWRMVTEYNVWRMILKFCVWRQISKCEITRQTQHFKIRRQTQYFKIFRQTQFSVTMRQTCIMSGIVYKAMNTQFVIGGMRWAPPYTQLRPTSKWSNAICSLASVVYHIYIATAHRGPSYFKVYC